jgi:uncharacterized protein YeaO (DUF488 family)
LGHILPFLGLEQLVQPAHQNSVSGCLLYQTSVCCWNKEIAPCDEVSGALKKQAAQWLRKRERFFVAQSNYK